MGSCGKRSSHHAPLVLLTCLDKLAPFTIIVKVREKEGRGGRGKEVRRVLLLLHHQLGRGGRGKEVNLCIHMSYQ